MSDDIFAKINQQRKNSRKSVGAALMVSVMIHLAIGIVGGVWNGAHFDGGRLTAAMLESVAPGRAIWLKDNTGHNAAVSKKGLELAGITRDTPSPFGGCSSPRPRPCGRRAS